MVPVFADPSTVVVRYDAMDLLPLLGEIFSSCLIAAGQRLSYARGDMKFHSQGSEVLLNLILREIHWFQLPPDAGNTSVVQDTDVDSVDR